MNSREYTNAARYLAAENVRWLTTLTVVPRELWPSLAIETNRVRMWRSRRFVVQEFEEADGIVRLSVNRAALNRDGSWVENITWDELQQIKFQCGFGDREAVEIYPPSDQVVNVANMRHLFVLPERLPFSWRA